MSAELLTRQQAIDACMEFPGVYEDYPFDDGNWTAMRHGANKKIFAMVFEREGHIWLNLKAEPSWGDFWRGCYSAVVPAYHMNKEHWISVILDGSMTRDEVLRLIQDSFDLTAPKARKKKDN